MLSLPLAAHETRPAYLEVQQLSAEVYDFTFRQPQIGGRFLGLTVVSACELQGEAQHQTTTATLESKWRANCQGLSIEEAGLGIAGLERTLIDTLVHVRFLNGATLNRILTPRAWRFEPTEKRVVDFLPAYFILGLEHLLLGLDHLAFLLVLLYLIPSYKKLLIAVTTFTLAHSITLGLSAFELLQVPQKPVEAVIALSILVVAWEVTRLRALPQDRTNSQLPDNHLPDSHPLKNPPAEKEPLILAYPWCLTFVFGLLHGLGFASALAEIGLPEEQSLWALLLFNLGIEAGQIMVILLLLLCLAMLRAGLSQLRLADLPQLRPTGLPQLKPTGLPQLRPTGLPQLSPTWLAQTPVYVSGGLAVYWLIERTSSILLGL